jgi:hypothetical protein
MKKIIFGMVAAICVAFGFSSFVNKRPTVYYWFPLKTDFARSGVPNCITNADITHPDYRATSFLFCPTLPAYCTGTSYWCLAAFSLAQLTSEGQYLNTISECQIAAGYCYTRD